MDIRAEDCERRGSFSATLAARFGTMGSRSVRWIDAAEPQIAAKEIPTRPVPAPSSRARTGERCCVSGSASAFGSVLRSVPEGDGARILLRRFDSRYDDTQVLLPRLSAVREGSLSVMVKLPPEPDGIVKERRISGIAVQTNIDFVCV